MSAQQPSPSSTPQDAPPLEPSSTTPLAQPPVAPLAAPALPTPVQVEAPERQQGANWGLVVFGILVAVVGGGVFANQVAGFEVRNLSTGGPTVLVAVGLLCALVGIIGMLSRRRR